MSKILLYDIETSLMKAYTFYIGRKVNLLPSQVIENSKIICICYKWMGEKEVKALVWDQTAKYPEKKMLEDFMKVVHQADVIYGQNSNSFDNRWVRTSLMLNKVKAKWNNLLEMDLLQQMRRSFRLPSNKLGVVCKQLGLETKDNMCLQDWIDIDNGKKAALNKMVKYCKQDVVILENAIKRMLPYMKLTPREVNAFNLTNRIPYSECPKCKSEWIKKNGVYKYKDKVMQKYICNSCSSTFPLVRDIKEKAAAKLLERK